MNDPNFVKQSLYLQGLPTYEADIQHIQTILFTIDQAQSNLKKVSPNLNQTVPITVVDKRLI
ncbi:hypothetical protein NSA56_01080 [Oceanobacillus caeni]|uniref:hypothetical protein n=1 Tax=Oceanobacillus caeni TaxID=405946 RepID=UPI002149E995|nr:hypothetical protein [Oceanobacillus caeni]MCR1832987.1 hypothetical protein [Oceanobacillus caeni]